MLAAVSGARRGSLGISLCVARQNAHVAERSQDGERDEHEQQWRAPPHCGEGTCAPVRLSTREAPLREDAAQRVEESALTLIPSYPYSAPYEELRLKAR